MNANPQARRACHLRATWRILLTALTLAAAGCKDSTKEALISESWEAIYLQGSKIGHAHQTTHRIEGPDGDRLKIVSREEIQLQRFGQSVVARTRLESIETPEGVVIEVAYEQQIGDDVIRARGTVDGETLVLTRDDQSEPRKIRWSWRVGGFFAEDRILSMRPMEVGETRSVLAFMPLLDQVVTIELTAAQVESTDLVDRQASLLRIDAVYQLGGGQELPGMLWADRTGTVFKSTMTAAEMTSYRTSRDVAMRPVEAGQFDLGLDSKVAVERPLENVHAAAGASYSVRLTTGDDRTGAGPAAMFVSSGSQRVTPVDASTARIDVRAIRPGQELPWPDRRPTDGDLAGGSLIEVADSRIVQMGQAVGGELQDAWEVAVSLEKYVHAKMQPGDFTRVFSSAGEVARSLQGDCTEYAVLLAALLRSRGIPTRVAFGLVYVSDQQGFLYHMWDEAWIGDRWIPLDATLGLGGIGGGHLKLGDSDLSDEDAYVSLISVLGVVNRLSISPIDAPTDPADATDAGPVHGPPLPRPSLIEAP